MAFAMETSILSPPRCQLNSGREGAQAGFAPAMAFLLEDPCLRSPPYPARAWCVAADGGAQAGLRGARISDCRLRSVDSVKGRKQLWVQRVVATSRAPRRQAWRVLESALRKEDQAPFSSPFSLV